MFALFALLCATAVPTTSCKFAYKLRRFPRSLSGPNERKFLYTYYTAQLSTSASSSHSIIISLLTPPFRLWPQRTRQFAARLVVRYRQRRWFRHQAVPPPTQSQVLRESARYKLWDCSGQRGGMQHRVCLGAWVQRTTIPAVCRVWAGALSTARERPLEVAVEVQSKLPAFSVILCPI